MHEQNAGIIFLHREDGLHFHTFEASPRPKDVTLCEGRLRCLFPGPSTKVPWEVASDPGFLKPLGAFLGVMDTLPFPDAQKTVHRVGNKISESRETVDPIYITEAFTGIIRGIGSQVEARPIEKNIRDEVNLRSAQNPWRRTALWLVVRVALQSILSHDRYKLFMLEVFRFLLRVVTSKQRDLENDTISNISRKLARRVQKLEERSTTIPKRALDQILETISRASTILQYRWGQAITESDRLVEWSGNVVDVRCETNLTLDVSFPWIENCLKVWQSRIPNNNLVEDPTEKGRYLSPTTMPILSGTTQQEVATSLIDFELWIEHHLAGWCRGRSDEDIIRQLSNEIESYHQTAQPAYQKRNIFDLSRMILTILEMWMRLDQALCRLEPLAAEYAPEIRHKIFKPLLFIEKLDMERLTSIEMYLSERNRTSKPSIFTKSAVGNSFAVRYFDSSCSLSSLRDQIVADANRTREEKRNELRTDYAQYLKLIRDANSRQCTRRLNRSGIWGHKSSKCAKCSLQRRAKKMKIQKHEWPLPANENEMKTLIFELQPHLGFAMWRDITYYILTEVFELDRTAEIIGKSWAVHDINRWSALRSHDKRKNRISIASKNEAIGDSHHKTTDVSLTEGREDRVLHSHCGNYFLRDMHKKEWIGTKHRNISLTESCKSQVKFRGYAGLEYAVNGSQHDQNRVIASQEKCPSRITLHEYIEFGSLRAGESLQWMNISSQLGADILTFKSHEVHALVMHAACQVGTRSESFDWRRKAHIDIGEEEFCRELLNIIFNKLGVIRDNWAHTNTMKTLVLLTRRVLSCGHEGAAALALDCLQKSRDTCIAWLEKVRAKLVKASEDDEIQDLRKWILRICGVQASTFDVDPRWWDGVFEAPEEMVKFIKCQNDIYDNCLGIISDLPSDIIMALDMNRRSCIRLENIMQRKISENPVLLDLAAQKIYPTGRVVGVWSRLGGSGCNWWRLESTINSETDKKTTFHLDPIQGRFLVDGKPNGRLPAEYASHETYKRILRNVSSVVNHPLIEIFETNLPESRGSWTSCPPAWA